MKQLDKAIYDEINGSVALKAALGDTRFYADSAPQNTAFPFLVWLWLVDMHEETFNTELENASLQFSIFSEDQSVVEVNDIFEKLTALFDNAALTVADYYSVRIRRVSSNRMKDPEQAWHYLIEYQFLVQKQ